ncbi:hypothetical protein TBLA_0B09140 [Henningerozyma blattae CBS 6284]|uniref:Vacuolar-sorting protein SNF7 n=1 Tax=Henningerozyma blattae (strain ATCC 34711 / CBS 6284 / DSM 70876 / NBRC 10599 / NRRL Y-10934 / UCD 77-7) TaxID=1071380 RepID=I2H027_HENB6|nr:hypothetical protein TBLA_0B09140 [Tetrapisispora blattae CBS 6284]CCH59729.1 hypothetical protein TBLA_0B09140 [Tetrapisispora blattae CBS 6284]
MWNYFFGGGGSSSLDDSSRSNKKDLPKKAIVELREHINLLTKKQNHLQTQIDNQTTQIKAYLNKGQKLQAKNSLKRRKIFENQLEKLNGQIDSLEQQLFSIESANLNLETMRAMKQGANAMKSIHKGMDIDKVDDTMDDIREQVELGEEISDAISRPLFTNGLSNDLIDEDELDNELEALAEDTTHEEALKTTQEVNTPKLAKTKAQELPNIPSNKIKDSQIAQNPVAVDEEEDDEDERALRELQAEMGL